MTLPVEKRAALIPHAERGTFALILLTLAAYVPAMSSGWLEYDDAWLVRENPVLRDASLSALRTIFIDFGFETRVTLGAEYLPVRDLVVLFLHGVLELSVEGQHMFQLQLYVLAALYVRAILIELFGRRTEVELCALLFALHPVHVESVAWLAGMKDVLALLFTAAAMHAYLRSDGKRAWLVVVLSALACFSKGVSVVLPLLLLLTDYLRARRPRYGVVACVGLVSAGALLVHTAVGRIVGMLAEPIGGSTTIAAASMSWVLLRYLGLSYLVHPHSVVYEVEALELGDARVWLALVVLGTAASLGVVMHRRGVRWPLFALGIFVVALLPVSQIAAPLQNQMADRYLLVAVLGPMLLLTFGLAGATTRLSAQRVYPTIAAALALVFTGLCFFRAGTFSDPVLLFTEATERTRVKSVAPYQLALAYEARERDDLAEPAYRIAYARDEGRAAGNNLGRLLFRNHRVEEALTLYRALHARYPNDPRALWNLSRVSSALGRDEEADHYLQTLRRRFPTYERDRLVRRQGPLSEMP